MLAFRRLRNSSRRKFSNRIAVVSGCRSQRSCSRSRSAAYGGMRLTALHTAAAVQDHATAAQRCERAVFLGEDAKCWSRLLTRRAFAVVAAAGASVAGSGAVAVLKHGRDTQPLHHGDVAVRLVDRRHPGAFAAGLSNRAGLPLAHASFAAAAAPATAPDPTNQDRLPRLADGEPRHCGPRSLGQTQSGAQHQ